MLPNFTIVICGAVLTVLMLAVTGSGLVVPETRTRIGEMPEIGRPMMQRMMAEPAAQAELAALELSRRAEELGRLRDLVPAIVQPDADTSGEDLREASPQAAQDVPQGAGQEAPREATEPTVREGMQEPARETAGTADIVEHAGASSASATPPLARVETPTVVASAAPAQASQTEDLGKAAPEARIAPPAPIEAGSGEAMGPETAPKAVAALSDAAAAAPSIRPGSRVNVRLPRPQRAAKTVVVLKKPVRHAARHWHRHGRRAYAARAFPVTTFGPAATQFR
jgi:hypothetical protein